MKYYAFVYGTLKKGYRNNILLSQSVFVQEATTKPKYKIYDCGMYPCMIKDDKGNSITGEIYEIDETTLARLDRLEGVPYLYQRDEIQLENFDKPTLAYFYQDTVEDFIDCGTTWPRKK
jgi:gamma-glutamylcyclotransferase (GGCT)/AIG2-like uncharacterized protein YtfP